jgi:class 3 adenylate cyclase
MDVREVLPAIRVPTLVIARTGVKAFDIRSAQFVAERIPNARLVELPGNDGLPWIGDVDPVVDEIEEFVTGARRPHDLSRELATVLFTDIVGSTERASGLGDARWRTVLESHREIVRRQLGRFRGREIETAGDGFLAIFDGPARAVQCALAIEEEVALLGIEVRAGCHTGEIERTADGIGGIAVHIGARLAALARPSEVLVSQTVKDLASGAELIFQDYGEHKLKGVTDGWRLYRAIYSSSGN